MIKEIKEVKVKTKWDTFFKFAPWVTAVLYIAAETIFKAF